MFCVLYPSVTYSLALSRTCLECHTGMYTISRHPRHLTAAQLHVTIIKRYVNCVSHSRCFPFQKILQTAYFLKLPHQTSGIHVMWLQCRSEFESHSQSRCLNAVFSGSQFGPWFVAAARKSLLNIYHNSVNISDHTLSKWWEEAVVA